jgi:acyl carrier protein
MAVTFDSSMSEQDITEQLLDYILNDVANARPAERPGPDFPIVQAGLLDSLGIFKVIAFIEEKFQVPISPEDIVLENFATVRAISDLIRGKLNSGA